MQPATTNSTREMLDRFADSIVSVGIESVPVELLTDLVREARAVDASPVVIGVLVDPTEPAVVRERAFMKLAVRLIGRANNGSPTRRDLLVLSPA